ncbi:hypothetical protein CLV46_0993 [Diaminobutyricimonas aerilata]|uniref:Regulation of enolase protein 1 (Concanavalin A-like superfamily) n=1 Tax=Diaminobutyricimonas aerilata TaxID=1162967 RepID=A0A2M9CHW2_9MICO|nr:DUF1349 domain-containing protein [Diaminobutyricimonas aerilata]PJJ71445.1 hypothetical protein CLV46_0993 [Diaminobutyricimonas aerilata]
MTIALAALPELTWTGEAGAAAVDDTGTLVLTSAGGADWTNDALGGAQQHAATALGFTAPPAIALSARVAVDSPRSTFDAGALAIWGDRDHWAKLCLEFSPHGQAMIVSVVTDGFSDDCNSTVVTVDAVHLRVIRTGPGWAFHWSLDGVRWEFVRLFRLGWDGPVTVGFLAQAPMGDSCTARFDRIAFDTVVPADLRDGS